VQAIPERWRFNFDDDEVSLRDLSWPQAVEVFRDAEAGELVGQSDGECVTLEFNAVHAAVLCMGRDRVILRPYFPRRPADIQDLEPFVCSCCGIRLGDQDEYLARFLLSRADGFRLFAEVLASSSLPSELSDPHPGQPVLPGFEEAVAEMVAGRALQWCPLPEGKSKHAEAASAGMGDAIY
jgi:hypothetical protein